VRDIDVAAPHPRDRRDGALAGVRNELLDGIGAARNAYA
jgi:sulfonate transport system ATP-binding protein